MMLRCCCVALSAVFCVPVLEAAEQNKRIPLVYGTDLFHPHDDPDDHFDLATVFALTEFDVRAILLDLGERQAARPGRIPVDQMLVMTGRRIPYATGLGRPLLSPADPARDQPQVDQGAVELLLTTLRDATKPVVMVTTGSLRDTCAAFNREPELMRTKISRLYINIGHLETDKKEWNVKLDEQSYIGLMRSGLPIYWCPCLPMNQDRSTHWVFRHDEILSQVSPVLLNWFVYALQRVQPGEVPPDAVLTRDLTPWRQIMMPWQRNMWCTGPLIHAAGRSIYQVGDRYVADTVPPENAKPVEVFRFVRARVEIDNNALTRWDADAPNPNMYMYRVADPKTHRVALTSCLRSLLEQFPVVPDVADRVKSATNSRVAR